MESTIPAPPNPVKEATDLWWLPLITGIAWLIISLIVLRFDATSVTTVGLLAGLVFIGAGFTDLMVSTLVDEWKAAYIILGVLMIIIGVIALTTPENTFLALAAVVGWLLLFKGTFDIVIALSNRQADMWWLTLMIGIFEIGLAFWAAGYFGRQAILVIVFVAAAAMTRGITQIILAFQLREVNQDFS